MKNFARLLSVPVLALVLILLGNAPAQACAACYGDTSGSKMSNAASIGIAAMVVLMFAMLGAIAAFGWHLAYRAKNPLPDYDELLSPHEGDVLPDPSS